MHFRQLGKTGIEVSEVAFGSWQLGNNDDWNAMDDRTAHRLVHEAIDAGVNLFDTAPNYAATNSERLLGEALNERRHDVVLVSKFGHPPNAPKDFSVERFWPSLESTLQRLRTDYLDVLLLHNPEFDMYAGTDPLWDALEDARGQGKIRHYGASLDFAREIEACVTNTRCTVFEILFNIFHQDVRRTFPIVKEKGIGTIVKVPLDSGWLTGRFNAQSSFGGIRSRWSPGQIEHRAALVAQLDWLIADGTSLATKALAYTLAYEEVSCVIPGIRTLSQLASNVQASGHALSDRERVRLERFWEDITNNGENPLPW